MAKSNEELKQIKKEYEALKTKLQELTKDETKEITGGTYQKDKMPDKNAKVIF